VSGVVAIIYLNKGKHLETWRYQEILFVNENEYFTS
jgi:hypothetical protein